MDTGIGISRKGILLTGTTLMLAVALFTARGALGATANSYGIVSGKSDAGTVTANTNALKSLASTFSGDLTFPDGATYYFNDVIPFHDGIHIDLMGSTLSFSKIASGNDRGSGFIFAIRDFSIANGHIDINYDGTGFPLGGNALKLGQRSSDGGNYFQPSLDSDMSAPMGNITVSNLLITSNNPNQECGIALTGGLQNVHISNVTIDGENQLICGIYYEFGQATQVESVSTTPKPPPPATSHAHQMTFSGITVRNLKPVPPPKVRTIALGIGGAYDTVVDGLTVTGIVDHAFLGTAGEAAFYKMWPAQVAAADRTVTLRNISADQIRNSAISLSGAGYFQNVAVCGSEKNPEGYCGYLGEYLDPSSYTAANETDEVNYVLDGFNVKAAAGSDAWGIYTNARSVDIRNGTLTGFESGFVATDDCTMIHLSNIKVLDSLEEGIRLDFGGGIWSTPRPKSGYIKVSTIAGSGTLIRGSYAVGLQTVNNFLVANNVFGYPLESSQGGALKLGNDARNVISHENKVVGLYGAGAAYVNGTAGVNGDGLRGNTGITTRQGVWAILADPAPAMSVLSSYLVR